MKQKFKVGDKVTPTNKDDYFYGKIGLIEEIKSFNGGISVNYNDPSLNHDVGYYNPKGLKLAVKAKEKQPTLTIKKLTRKRKGEEYFTWQFSVKGKVSGHNFNSKQGRDKSLKNFIKYIQENDFKIVNK